MREARSCRSRRAQAAEGAGRWSAADESRVYAIGRGERCEAVSGVEIAEALLCDVLSR